MLKAVVQSAAPDPSGMLKATIQSGKTIPDTFKFTVPQLKKTLPVLEFKSHDPILQPSFFKSHQVSKIELFRDLLNKLFYDFSDPDVKNLVYQTLFKKFQQSYEDVTENED